LFELTTGNRALSKESLATVSDVFQPFPDDVMVIPDRIVEFNAEYLGKTAEHTKGEAAQPCKTINC
jgi:hypothetical protein